MSSEEKVSIILSLISKGQNPYYISKNLNVSLSYEECKKVALNSMFSIKGLMRYFYEF